MKLIFKFGIYASLDREVIFELHRELRLLDPNMPFDIVTFAANMGPKYGIPRTAIYFAWKGFKKL